MTPNVKSGAILHRKSKMVDFKGCGQVIIESVTIPLSVIRTRVCHPVTANATEPCLIRSFSTNRRRLAVTSLIDCSHYEDSVISHAVPALCGLGCRASVCPLSSDKSHVLDRVVA